MSARTQVLIAIQAEELASLEALHTTDLSAAAVACAAESSSQQVSSRGGREGAPSFNPPFASSGAVAGGGGGVRGLLHKRRGRKAALALASATKAAERGSRWLAF